MEKRKDKPFACPYCNEEIRAANYPYCKACKVTVFICPSCHEPTSREKETCIHCGANIKC